MDRVVLEKSSEPVDVCHACGGVFIDWFDGEVRDIVATLDAQPAAVGAKSLPGLPAVTTCPRCNAPMAHVAGEWGAFIGRCGECFGSFVPRTSFEAIVSAIPPSQQMPPAPLTLWERLRAALDELLERH